jgi:hypothetical protein
MNSEREFWGFMAVVVLLYAIPHIGIFLAPAFGVGYAIHKIKQ